MEREARGTDPTRGGLDRDQVAEVLRRAAELDAASEDLRRLPELVAPEVVEEAAVEAGLSRESVRRALVELALTTHHPVPVTAPEGVRDGRITLVRRVRGNPDAVTERIERFLRRQLFVRERIYDGGSWWAPDRGQNARMRRDMDLRGRHVLRPAASVELRVVPDTTVDGDHVVVRFEVDVSGLRRRQRRALTRSTTVGVAASGGLAIVVGPEALLVAAPVSVGLATRRQLRGRDRAARASARIDVALNGLLDRIDHDLPDEQRALPRRSARGGRPASRDPGGSHRADRTGDVDSGDAGDDD